MANTVIMPHWSKYRGQDISTVPEKYLLWLYYEWGMQNSGELHREVRTWIERNVLPKHKAIK